MISTAGDSFIAVRKVVQSPDANYVFVIVFYTLRSCSHLPTEIKIIILSSKI